MNILLWVLQVLLALAFFAHGWMFLFPPAAIAAQMDATLPRWFTLFLGVAEILAAFGLTIPGVTRIMPWLVPAAALGIMMVLGSATVYHFIRNEISSGFITLVMFALATVVAYYRWKVLPIRSRGGRMKLGALFLITVLFCPLRAAAQTKAIVPASYVVAADALAFDDYAKAKLALWDLVKEAQGDLRQRAEVAASAPNIAAMRRQFRALSQLVSKMDLPPGHCLVLCKMFENGAYWVQKGRIPANPYMGQAMLSCGDIVKVAPE